MQYDNFQMEWDQAFRSGHRLVLRAIRPNEGAEEDLILARLCAKALLLGIDERLISKCMRENSENYLASLIKQRTH